MFCTKCGAELPDDATFCGECGARTVKGPPQDGQEASGQMPRVGQTPPDAQGTAASASPNQVSSKSKRNKAILIAISIGVLALIVIAVVTRGFGLLGASNSQNTSNGFSKQTGETSTQQAANSSVQVQQTCNAYSWGDLSTISNEIAQSGSESAAIEVAKKYNLVNSAGVLDGSQSKQVALSDGTSTTVQIAGFYHDDKTGGGKAGITFIFQDAVAAHVMYDANSNSGGWQSSSIRSYLSSTVMSLLPSDLSSAIVAVDKRTNNTGKTTSASSVTTTSDKLWLFSSVELCSAADWFSGKANSSSYNDVLSAEGSQYQLFADQGVTQHSSDTHLVKNYRGTACIWWCRSASPGGSENFLCVTPDGKSNGTIRSDGPNYAVPGFCI